MSSAVWQQHGDGERAKRYRATVMSWMCERKGDSVQTTAVRFLKRSPKGQFENAMRACGEDAIPKNHSAEDDVKKEP